jgi:hypothetical protein
MSELYAKFIKDLLKPGLVYCDFVAKNKKKPENSSNYR